MLLKIKKQKLYLIKYSMRKTIITLLCFRYAILPATYGIDIVERVFTPSKQQNQIIDIWNTKDSVWNTVFRWSINLLTWETQQPLYVRMIKIILRATLIIWVSMGIVVGIKYIYTQWNEAEQKKTLWYLWNIIYWILIALWSLVIVELILSITRTSVTF